MATRALSRLSAHDDKWLRQKAVFLRNSPESVQRLPRVSSDALDPVEPDGRDQPGRHRGTGRAIVLQFVGLHPLPLPPSKAEHLAQCENGVRESEPSLRHAASR